MLLRLILAIFLVILSFCALFFQKLPYLVVYNTQHFILPLFSVYKTQNAQTIFSDLKKFHFVYITQLNFIA